MKASIDVFSQTFLNQLANFRRRRWRQRSVVGLSVEHRRDRVVDRFSSKRLPSREQLKQNASKCPNIGALVQRLAANLLRPHVCRRAKNPSRFCRIGAERR